MPLRTSATSRHVLGLSSCHACAAQHGCLLWGPCSVEGGGLLGPVLASHVAGGGQGDTPQVRFITIYASV